jgi:hypothetical protein
MYTDFASAQVHNYAKVRNLRGTFTGFISNGNFLPRGMLSVVHYFLQKL